MSFRVLDVRCDYESSRLPRRARTAIMVWTAAKITNGTAAKGKKKMKNPPHPLPGIQQASPSKPRATIGRTTTHSPTRHPIEMDGLFHGPNSASVRFHA